MKNFLFKIDTNKRLGFIITIGSDVIESQFPSRSDVLIAEEMEQIIKASLSDGEVLLNFSYKVENVN